MSERGAIELIEEATRLFRAGVGLYYIGSLPFVLGFLFFWMDMSGSAFAYQTVAPGSFGVALLYLWMKGWQAIHAAEMRNRLDGRAGPRWTARRVLRLAMQQSAVQPTALIAIPVGLLLALPFAWIYGFYQNFSVLGDGSEPGLRAPIAQSKAYAALWIRQSWLVLGIQTVFAIFVFVNIGVALFMIPHLLRMLTGFETVFAISGFGAANSTFFAVCLGLTYLCVGPIMKAIYVLRCFYGESVRSGADLRGMWVAILLVLSAAPARPQAPISGPELDRAIDQVIHQRQYAWRLPRQHAAKDPSKQSLFVRFTENVWRGILRGIRRFGAWIGEQIRKMFSRREGNTGGRSPVGALRAGSYLLVFIFAVGLAFLLIRALGQRPPRDAAEAVAVAAPVDLSAENLVADQLPEEGWRALARDWTARRDFRMALRALYLASLAYLGERELIRIHRAKSNRDYQRELERRARSTPELGTVFGENLAVFESSWYGRREVGPDAIDAFAANLDRMKACAE